ncbi:MBL fold metallo-hydrolase [Candidatus Latescibacterota bacterium]
MYRIIKYAAIVIVLHMMVSALTAQRRETQPVQFVKISENLYEITGGRGARGGMYIGDDSILFIDAKMDKASMDQVFAGARRLTDKPLRYLISTHSDGDHITGNRFFPESVTIIAHENCRVDFFRPKRDGSPSDWYKPELAPFVPSITYRDKLDLYLGSKKVELHHFGTGHTTGDTVVYFPEEDVAFVADQYMMHRPQLIHAYKDGNSFGHVENLKKMLDVLDTDTFYNGHADMTNRQGILEHIVHMERRHIKVKNLISQKKNLGEIQKEFEENEAALVEIIYNEITRR